VVKAGRPEESGEIRRMGMEMGMGMMLMLMRNMRKEHLGSIKSGYLLIELPSSRKKR
jgi:hypothetical protein